MTSMSCPTTQTWHPDVTLSTSCSSARWQPVPLRQSIYRPWPCRQRNPLRLLERLEDDRRSDCPQRTCGWYALSGRFRLTTDSELTARRCAIALDNLTTSSLSPQLVVSNPGGTIEERVEFGPVEGGTSVVTVGFANSGQAPLHIYAPVITGTNVALVDPPTAGYVLLPGESTDLQVELLNPSQPANATLQISSDDPRAITVQPESYIPRDGRIGAPAARFGLWCRPRRLCDDALRKGSRPVAGVERIQVLDGGSCRRSEDKDCRSGDLGFFRTPLW